MEAPTKGSLSKFRNKISYKFFVDYFNKLIGEFGKFRPTYHGRKIYAIDGKKIYVPRTKDLEKKGFVGRVISKWRSSYMLQMHITHAYDVLSGTSKAVRVGAALNEIKDAMSMIKKFEKFSITIYDRLYLCKKLIRAHLRAKNSFLMRAKKDSTLKEIVEFRKSKKTTDSFIFEGVRLYLYRVTKKKVNFKDEAYALFLSDLSPEKFSRKK